MRVVSSSLEAGQVGDPELAEAIEKAIAGGDVIRETYDLDGEEMLPHVRLMQYPWDWHGGTRWAVVHEDAVSRFTEDTDDEAEAVASYEQHVRELFETCGWMFAVTDVTLPYTLTIVSGEQPPGVRGKDLGGGDAPFPITEVNEETWAWLEEHGVVPDHPDRWVLVHAGHVPSNAVNIIDSRYVLV